MVLLIVAGFQVPVTPLGAVVDKIGAIVPSQNEGMAAKSETVCGLTVTINVCAFEHCPKSGVKV